MADQKKQTEQEVIYQIIKDINDLRIRYISVWLDDFLWERLIEEQKNLSAKYKQFGDNIHKFYCSMAASLVEYKERQQKEIKAAGVNMREGDIVKRIIQKQNGGNHD